MWNSDQLDSFSGALFEKISRLIEQYIEQGFLIEGERLPSEREMAKSFKVNRSTIVHALDILTSRNVLIRRQGSGTFVNDQKWGLQSYPTIHWHIPSQFNKKVRSSYQEKVKKIREQKNNICDLANGDLPFSLVPKLSLSNIATHELVSHEKNSEQLHLGLPSLKQHICLYMKQLFGMNVDDNNVLITSGTQQSLFLISQGLLRPGDAIGIESPSYFYSLPLFQAAGLRLYGIDVDREGITLDSLQQTTQRYRIKWLFLNPIFQNPTGHVMSENRKKSILAFCKDNYMGIVEDDAYSGLSFSDKTDISPIKKYDQNNQVIYLGSLSKYIGKSIRIGWMIAPKEIIQKLAEIRQHIDSGLSILPQLLAEDYLQNHYIEHQKMLQHYFKCQSEQLIFWCEKQLGYFFQYHKPLGGFHLYLNLALTSAKQESDILNHLLSKNIIVSQGHDFGDKLGSIRLSYGHFYPQN